MRTAFCHFLFKFELAIRNFDFLFFFGWIVGAQSQEEGASREASEHSEVLLLCGDRRTGPPFSLPMLWALVLARIEKVLSKWKDSLSLWLRLSLSQCVCAYLSVSEQHQCHRWCANASERHPNRSIRENYRSNLALPKKRRIENKKNKGFMTLKWLNQMVQLRFKEGILLWRAISCDVIKIVILKIIILHFFDIEIFFEMKKRNNLINEYASDHK